MWFKLPFQTLICHLLMTLVLDYSKFWQQHLFCPNGLVHNIWTIWTQNGTAMFYNTHMHPEFSDVGCVWLFDWQIVLHISDTFKYRFFFSHMFCLYCGPRWRSRQRVSLIIWRSWVQPSHGACDFLHEVLSDLATSHLHCAFHRGCSLKGRETGETQKRNEGHAFLVPTVELKE